MSIPCVSDLAQAQIDRAFAEAEAFENEVEWVIETALEDDLVYGEITSYMIEDDRMIEVFESLRQASKENRNSEVYEDLGRKLCSMYDDMLCETVENNLYALSDFIKGGM